MTARLFDRQGVAVEAVDGVFPVFDLREYTLEADADEGTLPELPPHVRRLARDGHIVRVCFDNYVGLAEVGSMRFDVTHSKLTSEQFNELLDDVTERTQELAFGFESPTGFSASEAPVSATEWIPYHALAYLRHVMTRLLGGEGLLGQFLEIARAPHRRVETEPAWVPLAQAANVSPGALLAVGAHPERLVRISRTHPLAATSLGRALHQRREGQDEWRFPSELLDVRREETFDTHENRLVKAFLGEALDLVTRFDERELRNPALRADVSKMRGELEWMASHDFLSDVSELTVFPASSTVLQRRAGYKELFQHWLALRTATALSDDRLWQRLLDAKDCATLYEMWCFFAVKAELDELCGPATQVTIETGETEAKVPWKASVNYKGGRVELTYNRTYPGVHADRVAAQREDTSYSVALRPDVTVHVRRADEKRHALVLDAKFKFDGKRLADVAKEDAKAEEGDADEEAPVRRAVRDDIHKMHAYRDALRDVVGAFVLFPGTDDGAARYRAEVGGRDFEGVGAIPLVPGQQSTELKALLSKFLHGPGPG